MLFRSREVAGMILTFLMALFGWIFFRSETMTQAIEFIKRMFTFDMFKSPKLPELADMTLAFIIFFFIIEWLGREHKYALERFGFSWYFPFRWLFYSFLMLCVFVFSGNEQEFIYFQF